MPRQSFWREKPDPVDPLIGVVLEEMQRKGVYSEEYPGLLDKLERLHEIKKQHRRNRVSRDTLAMVFGNLAGILLIVAYEQKHVVTSRGFGQIIRPKALQ
jgi:hypothetical protein